MKCEEKKQFQINYFLYVYHSTLDYPNNQLFNLTASCNSRCQCDNIFDPVCGENGVMYYSSCYAGCAIENKPDDETKVRTNEA